MAISAYTRTTYNNRASPAAGPTNLNKNETQLKALSDEFTNSLIRPTDTKATIVDADEVGGNNSADSFKWVKWTWTTVKAWIILKFAVVPTKGTPPGGVNGIGQVIVGTASDTTTIYQSGTSNLTGTWDFRFIQYVTSTKVYVSSGRRIGESSINAGTGNTIDFDTTRIS